MRAQDTRFWDQEYVQLVAEQIESQVTYHDESACQIPQLTQKVRHWLSYLRFSYYRSLLDNGHYYCDRPHVWLSQLLEVPR